jgi:DNA-binding MarR family transcriptional regulator
MGDEEKKQIRRLLKVIEFIRSHNAEMPIQTLGCFLLIALEEGQTITGIGDKLKLSQSSASRNVSELTERSWKKVEGLKVAEYHQSYENITQKTLHLTTKGQKWADMISSLLKGEKV